MNLYPYRIEPLSLSCSSHASSVINPEQREVLIASQPTFCGAKKIPIPAIKRQGKVGAQIEVGVDFLIKASHNEHAKGRHARAEHIFTRCAFFDI